MLVMKFGGTSVGSADAIKQVVSILKSNLERRPIVVVSALSKVTDSLIASAKSAVQGKVDIAELSERHFSVMRELGVDESIIASDLDELKNALWAVSIVKKMLPEMYAMIVSFGERMSSKIVAAYARNEGLNASAHNSYDMGLVTDSNYDEASVLPETYSLIPVHLGALRAGEIPMITGFIAKDREGSITTLGRGGSDYSATIFAISMNAEEVQIWTDVDGMMTTDPRIVPSARTIRTVSFNEAAELAYFGAKVLHPKTILPAIEKNIPVRVLNTFNPSDPGTLIVKHADSQDVITAIACKRNITVINISSPKMLFVYGFLEKVFQAFAQHRISVDIISTSEVSVSVTVDSKYDIRGLLEELRQFANVDVNTERSSISVVGHGMKHTPGISGVVFGNLGAASINVELISMGASEINLTFVVRDNDVEPAIKLLHRAFFEHNSINYKKGEAVSA